MASPEVGHRIYAYRGLFVADSTGKGEEAAYATDYTRRC